MSAKAAPKKRRPWIKWVVLAAIVVVVAVVAISMLGNSGTVSTVTTAKVERTTLKVVVSGSGNAAVDDVTEVQPGITGTVKNLSVKLGDTVKAGDVLFEIVNADLDAAVTRAKASYSQSKQSVQQAKSSVIQAQNSLYNAEHPSAVGTGPAPTPDARAITLAKQQVTVAKAGLATANINLTSASQALTQARDNAAKRTVTAPVSGVITILNAQNGQSLGSSSSSSGSSAASASGSTNSAVEISDLSTLRARISINEVDLVSVKVGQVASVTFDALPDVVATGTISAIAPTGTNSSGIITYNVDVKLDSVDALLRPTMSCTAEIVTDTRTDALTVPSAAVHTDSATQSKYCTVQATDGSTKQVVVKTGNVVGTTTEILSGLTEGQIVVTSAAGSSTTTSSSSTRGGFTAMMGGGR
ncbi:MAG TPA: efflux RND transporter periplasmic adaptor subunit [Coriobacteriia bacterium]